MNDNEEHYDHTEYMAILNELVGVKIVVQHPESHIGSDWDPDAPGLPPDGEILAVASVVQGFCRDRDYGTQPCYSIIAMTEEGVSISFQVGGFSDEDTIFLGGARTMRKIHGVWRIHPRDIEETKEFFKRWKKCPHVEGNSMKYCDEGCGLEFRFRAALKKLGLWGNAKRRKK